MNKIRTKLMRNNCDRKKSKPVRHFVGQINHSQSCPDKKNCVSNQVNSTVSGSLPTKGCIFSSERISFRIKTRKCFKSSLYY